MIGTEYLPQPGDSVLVLAIGGILIVNPSQKPVIIHANGTREVLEPVTADELKKSEAI